MNTFILGQRNEVWRSCKIKIKNIKNKNPNESQTKFKSNRFLSDISYHGLKQNQGLVA